jgi:hypothetical protein
MNDRENRIREIDYFIREEEGRPDGQADRHWQSAKAIVESQDAERKTIEGEPPGDALAEYVTPFSTLRRAPSSADSP